MKGKKKTLVIAIAIVVAIALAFLIWFLAKSNKNSNKDAQTEYTEFVQEDSYIAYLNEHKDATLTDEEVEILLPQYTASEGNVKIYEEYEGKTLVLLTGEEGYVEWTVEVSKTGFYQLAVDYLAYEGDGLDVERTIYIDGELPYDEAANVIFERKFIDVDTNPAVDIDGNDIRPNQEEQYVWQSKMVVDASGYYQEALKFYLTQGTHTLRLQAEKEPMMIGRMALCAEKEVLTYKEYKKVHGDAKVVKGAKIEIIQAEDLYDKSEKSNFPINDRTSAYTQPQDAYAILLNTVGGTRWQKVGSSLSWKVSVEKDGYYMIAPRYKQNYMSGVKVYRKLMIDGEVPFAEAANLSFGYDGNWQCDALGDGKEAYLFYFEAGKEYMLEMEVTLGDMVNILRRTEKSLEELNSIYRSILMITGPSPDKYRDYSFETAIPDTLVDLKTQADELSAIIAEFKSVNNASGERVAQLTKLETVVRRMADDSSEIAGKFGTFKDNLSALGTWISDMSNQPLALDYIAIVPEGEDVPKAEANFFENIAFQGKLFLSSFVIDYANMGVVEEDVEENVEIDVWVSTGRDQMNTIRGLINSDFAKKHNITVNLELVSPGTLLPSVLAGTGPDVALGNAIGDPINFALRDAAYDISSFEDYEEVIQRFSEEAMVPYTYKGATYALPETMQFNVMFYRKDIMNELGLKIPQTWDEWDNVISDLSKKNMMVGLPHDQNVFLIYMYQMGSELYHNEGESVNLDSREAYLAFEKLTEYYTLYDFETEYDFVNRFRTGEMPLAIMDYSVYNQLSLFAPEIKGDWGMALVPGTKMEDGSINRTNTFSGTSTILLNNSEHPEAAWEFMKWWSSTEIQAAYCNEMETSINASAKQPTANLEALKQLPWAKGDLETLIQVWDTLKGTPEVPGGYYFTRAYAFAFNQVINDLTDPSETLQKQIKSINSELTRKRQEFGIED